MPTNPSFYKGPGDYLNVNVALDTSGNRVLTVSLLPINGLYPNLPAAVFVYTNTGTVSLGAYQGVGNLTDLNRIQQYSSTTSIPVFGNKFVKHTEAKITLGLNDDYLAQVTIITNAIKALSTALKLKNNISEIVYIP